MSLTADDRIQELEEELARTKSDLTAILTAFHVAFLAVGETNADRLRVMARRFEGGWIIGGRSGRDAIVRGLLAVADRSEKIR